jgi:hypothetical protein
MAGQEERYHGAVAASSRVVQGSLALRVALVDVLACYVLACE